MQRNSISMWRDGLLMHLLSKKMTLLLVNIQLYFSAGYILAIINSIYFSQCVHNFLCRRCRFWSMAETFPFFLEQVLFQRKAGRGRRYEENLLSSFPRSIFFLWAHFFPSLNNDKLRMLWEKAQNSSMEETGRCYLDQLPPPPKPNPRPTGKPTRLPPLIPVYCAGSTSLLYFLPSLSTFLKAPLIQAPFTL